MTATESQAVWTEANQAYLVAEFARLKRHLAGETEGDAAASVQLARAALDQPPAIDRVCELFGLSTFERAILLLCAGVEMDSRLAAQCGEAQGHPPRACATFGLAMATLPDPHWSALTPYRPLRRFRLVEVEPGHPLTSAPLRIDERILHYVVGVNLPDPRLQSLMRASPFPLWIADDHKDTATQAGRVLEADCRQDLIAPAQRNAPPESKKMPFNRSRWLLPKRPWNLRDVQRAGAYYLKGAFQLFCFYRQLKRSTDHGGMDAFGHALPARPFQEIRAQAARASRLSWTKSHVSNGAVEGMNNKGPARPLASSNSACGWVTGVTDAPYALPHWPYGCT